jgi:cellulose biosynthesis protein BcsQ
LCHRKAFTDAIALGKGVTEMPAKDNKAASEIKDLWAELLSLAPNNVISMKEQA